MNNSAFARICRAIDFPMALVTAFDGNERSGCLVGFHTQCSVDPQRWLVNISKTNHTFNVALRAKWLAVHILRSDQHALAELFGGVSGDELAPATKFEQCAWRESDHGTPILEGCDWFAGPVIERIDAGDHVAHIIDIAACASAQSSPQHQLGYQAALVPRCT